MDLRTNQDYRRDQLTIFINCFAIPFNIDVKSYRISYLMDY